MKHHTQKQFGPKKGVAQRPSRLPAKPKQSTRRAIQRPAKPAEIQQHNSGARSGVSAKTNQAQRKPSNTKKKPDIKSSPRTEQVASKPRAKKKQAAPRTEAQYVAKPEKFKETWDRVISVISKMRSDKISLTQASRDARISPRTVTRWGSSALRKRKSGKYAAKATDNLLRLVLIPTPEGTREIAVRSSKQVSMLAEYWNALDRYIQTGDAAQLSKFRGKHIRDANGVDVPLPTELAVLNRLGSAGVLSFESLYARSA
jgi:hypothetical protein